MPHSRLIEVLDHLAEMGEVTERRMFGGYGLYFEGLFFGLLDRQGQFYLRADPDHCSEFQSRQGQPFRPDPEKKAMNYWSVSQEILADPPLLLKLAEAAVQLARLAKSAKSGKGP